MSADGTAELAERLSHAVVRLARQLRQQDEGELTPTMRAALGTIARDGPLTFGELAAIEQVAPPTITKVVAKLEDIGLVVREPDEADRRVWRVSLTEVGRRRLESDRRRRRRWLAERVEGLDEDDVDRLDAAVDVLERLTAR